MYHYFISCLNNQKPKSHSTTQFVYWPRPKDAIIIMVIIMFITITITIIITISHYYSY